MNYRDAIEWLNTDDFYAKGYEDAVKLAITALQKQIPVAPVISGVEYLCPACLDAVGKITMRGNLIKNHHCRCGQTIDWGWLDANTSRKQEPLSRKLEADQG